MKKRSTFPEAKDASLKWFSHFHSVTVWSEEMSQESPQPQEPNVFLRTALAITLYLRHTAQLWIMVMHTGQTQWPTTSAVASSRLPHSGCTLGLESKICDWEKTADYMW